MKKSFAILLLCSQLFNICGYQLFFLTAAGIADKQMIASLDKNEYNENDLVQIKCALNAPYIIYDIACERYDGQIEIGGIQYNYVQRMVKNDTLYLYCISNKQKTNINNAKNLYSKQNAENSSGKATEQAALKKISFLNESNLGTFSFDFHTYESSSVEIFSVNNLTTVKGFITKHLQPPDLFI